MKSSSSEEIINKIDELHQIHLSLRGILQYVGTNYEGKEKSIGNLKSLLIG